jgi:hypothetical protein
MSVGVMNRTLFRKQLQLGLNAVFGMKYRQYPEEWRDAFEVVTADKAVEEQVQEMGLGAGRVKAEGAGISYDSGRELWFSRFEAQTIALAFAITEEAEEDGLYGSIGKKYSSALARSMQYTKEVKGAAIFNNGFDASGAYNGGDGVPLYSTAHPLGGGGTFSNTLTTPADLGETALEALSIQIDGTTDDRGIPAMLRIKRAIIPKELKFVIERLLSGTERPGTADRDINAMNKMGTVPDWSVNRFLTDPNAWFLVTDAEGGLQHFKRKALSRGIEGDFETGNMRYKARERYVFGWHEPRGTFASSGST